MDFPMFHLDFIGNRMVVAITAIIHILINHPMAVGAIPMVTFLEWRAHKKGLVAVDDLLYKITFVFFIITTSVGAMTGVGIWFTTSLVNPDAIGSLLRVFFWAWFIEWIIFVLEVSFIMIYFLTWKKYRGERKKTHIRIGLVLGILSWLTMAIISGILGFMMNAGGWQPFFRVWTPNSSLFTAFFNPLYLPQLLFRTPFAFMTAGLFFLFLLPFLHKEKDRVHQFIVRILGIWTLFFAPLTVAAGFWYWKRIPAYMAEQAPVALTTQNFTQWYQTLLYILLGVSILFLLILLVGSIVPKRFPKLLMVVPFLAAITLLGYFERVREFIRKPYVIQDYMYANGLRVQDYDLYKEDGILPHATFVSHHSVTEENKLEAGKDVFMVTCSRCHTMAGINSVNTKFDDLFPDRQWDEQQISAFMATMHNVRPFMPPFPGNDAELDALAAYIVASQNRHFRLEGPQSTGLTDY